MKTDIPYLKHILDALNDIEISTKDLSKNEFKDNKDIRDATVRRLEIVGEAAKNISKKTRDRYKNIEWKKIIGTRDILIHRYFGVDWNTVWDILGKDLPQLKKEILEILTKIE